MQVYRSLASGLSCPLLPISLFKDQGCWLPVVPAVVNIISFVSEVQLALSPTLVQLGRVNGFKKCQKDAHLV